MAGNWIDDAYVGLQDIQATLYLVGVQFDATDALVRIEAQVAALIGEPDPGDIQRIRAAANPAWVPPPAAGEDAPGAADGREDA